MQLLKIFLLATVLSTASAFALEHHQFSLGVGTNFNFPDPENELGEGVDEEVSLTLAIAAKEELKINDQWYIRTGLWLQEKSARFSFEDDDLGFDGDLTSNTIYASIPLNAQFKASDLISIFAGYIADFRINDYCSASGDFDSCTLEDDSENIVHNVTAGVTFNFSQLIALDVGWQQGLSDVYKDGYKLSTFQSQIFFKF